MALQVEIWIDKIMEALNTSNIFSQYAVNHDEFVDKKTVHVPNAGAEPTITRNRNIFPATVESRTDADLTYDLDTYDFPPIRVGYVEELELSYNKWNSIMGQSMRALNQKAHDWLLYNWTFGLGAADIVTTTGTQLAANLIATGATGTRRSLLGADLMTVKKLMDKDDVPYEDRFLLLDVVQYNNLLDEIGYVAARDAIAVYDIAKGIVRELFGFNILKPRGKVVYGTSAGTTVRIPGHSGATTDSGISIAWHQGMVSRAIGNIEVFEALRDPGYYGDIVSGLVRMGGIRLRSDDKGVVLILQGTS